MAQFEVDLSASLEKQQKDCLNKVIIEMIKPVYILIIICFLIFWLIQYFLLLFKFQKMSEFTKKLTNLKEQHRKEIDDLKVYWKQSLKN
jgi:hypothetical protein